MINYPSTIGLILDIIGVLLLFRFGLPSKVLFEPRKTSSESERERAGRKNSNRKITVGAYIGLSFILIGFIFQLVGTNSEWFKRIFNAS